ncbi:DrmE family protein [Clostridium cadaveris]|uniref:DrmE family protein n=1 Tax=Clostridium cadaveris TaxID=1529 RepID=UPI0039932282
METMFDKKIKDIEIVYKKKKLSFNSFESLIINAIYKSLKSDKKNSLIISMEEELLTVYMLVTVGVITYYDNMKNPDNNILDIIKQDEKVCYKGKIYNFIGYEEINNKKYIKLKHEKDGITYSLLDNAFEITIYNGKSKRINKSKEINMNTNITKRFIAKTMCCNVNELDGAISKSNLIVMKGKEKLLELIDNIDIVFDEMTIPLTELFSIGYWSSEENCILVKNRIKERILFNITSNISTAIDIVTSDKEIKNIFIIGGNTFKESFETELRMLYLNPYIKKLIILGGWESPTDYSVFATLDEPYDIYAITKQCILQNINILNKDEGTISSSLQNLNYELMSNIVDKKINIINVKDENNLDKCIFQITRLLKQLCSYSEVDDNILNFVKISYSLCNRLESNVLSLSNCASSKEIINERIMMISKIKVAYNPTRSDYELMDYAVSIFKSIYESLVNNSDKYTTLKELLICNKNNTIVIVRYEYEVNDLIHYLMINTINGVKVAKYKKNMDLSQYDNIIVTYYDEGMDVLYSNKYKIVKLLCYKKEAYKYKRKIKQNTEMLSIISKNNLLCNEVHMAKSIVDDNSINEDEANEIFEIINSDDIENFIENHWIRIITNQESDLQQKSYGYTNTIAKKIVVFNDGRYAFLSKNYIVNAIDRKKDDIDIKTVDDIEKGDEIIFVANNKHGKEDIVKETIDSLLENEEFSAKFSVFFDYNRLWKDSLEAYMNKHFLNFNNISKMLANEGIVISSVAIANWLNGNVIGPQNLESIRLIAKIVDNIELNQKVDIVINSCKQVRSIQIQIRKAIAKMIINSVVMNQGDGNNMYNFVRSIVGNLNDYAYIGVVSKIYDIDKELSMQYVNKVIEGDE